MEAEDGHGNLEEGEGVYHEPGVSPRPRDMPTTDHIPPQEKEERIYHVLEAEAGHGALGEGEGVYHVLGEDQKEQEEWEGEYHVIGDMSEGAREEGRMYAVPSKTKGRGQSPGMAVEKMYSALQHN